MNTRSKQGTANSIGFVSRIGRINALLLAVTGSALLTPVGVRAAVGVCHPVVSEAYQEPSGTIIAVVPRSACACAGGGAPVVALRKAPGSANDVATYATLLAALVKGRHAGFTYDDSTCEFSHVSLLDH